MSDIVILDEQQSDVVPDTDKASTDKQAVSLIEKLNNMSLAFQNIKLKDKLIFYRLLSTMLNSGM